MEPPADSDGDGSPDTEDCNDENAERATPCALEQDNGADDNCNDEADEGLDADGDGYTPVFDGDCNDGDNTVYPGALEQDNGADDNCDGSTDEGLDAEATATRRIAGADCKDGDNTASIPARAELDNEKDDDCDGVTDEDLEPVDSDGDGIPDSEDDCPEAPGVAANNG